MSDYEGPDFRVLSTRRSVAAKLYVCNHCGHVIDKGDKYSRVVFLEDGVFHCERHHTHLPWCPDDTGIRFSAPKTDEVGRAGVQ